MRYSPVIAAAATLALALELAAPARSLADEAGPKPILTIESLSTRADLVSGGDVLVRVNLPTGTQPRDVALTVNGTPARDLQPAPDGRSVLARLTGLRDGANKVAAEADGSTALLTVTNHPIGGPIFTGPQLQPWFCDTETAGLGAPTDKKCNAPTRYTFWYRTPAGAFLPYDLDQPPPAAAVATTTIDTGRTVPYVVRVETTTINRGISYIAALFDPAQPWAPWAPQPGWNGKLYWVFGADCATGHRQSVDPTVNAPNGSPYFPAKVPDAPIPPPALPEPGHIPETGGVETVLEDMALARGFMVAASSLTNLGNVCNTAIHAETMMMTKERIVEQYGPIRYTMGTGCSGGSMSQHGIATQYPGLIQGLRPTCSFPDPWAVMTVNTVDCVLLNRYFETTSGGRTLAPAQRDGVYGYANGSVFCHQPLGAYRNRLWDPGVGGQGSDDFLTQKPCVPDDVRYDAQRNPRGVRCTPADYLVNIVGRRAEASWGPVERKIGRGFANRFLDNVGVQYGLAELQAGRISPEQFVDLNSRIGGWDIDGRWQPQRTSADKPALSAMYRSGQIIDGRALDSVAIIDYRSNWNDDVHDNRQSSFTRARIEAANGNTRNHARWIEPESIPFGLPPAPIVSFLVMDSWLSATEADSSGGSYADRLARNRPAEAADGCFVYGERVDEGVCGEVFTLPSDPRLVAGMPATRDILKCALTPLRRDAYDVAFTAAQWSRLEKAFPTGVCDWSKPGIGQQPNRPWLSFAEGPGGRPLGPPPVSELRRTAS